MFIGLMPSAIYNWLGEKLLAHGLDASVFGPILLHMLNNDACAHAFYSTQTKHQTFTPARQLNFKDENLAFEDLIDNICAKLASETKHSTSDNWSASTMDWKMDARLTAPPPPSTWSHPEHNFALFTQQPAAWKTIDETAVAADDPGDSLMDETYRQLLCDLRDLVATPVDDAKIDDDDDDAKRQTIMESLSKLNHDAAVSVFCPVWSRQAAKTTVSVLHDTRESTVDANEDLLTSARTHFYPINSSLTPPRINLNRRGSIPDGATFAIDAQPDRIAYMRTASGYLRVVEPQFDDPVGDGATERKYQEYREVDGDELDECDGRVTPFCATTRRRSEFVLKFCVRANEKCCQTDGLGVTAAGAFDLCGNVKMAEKVEWRSPVQFTSEELYSCLTRWRVQDDEADGKYYSLGLLTEASSTSDVSMSDDTSSSLNPSSLQALRHIWSTHESRFSDDKEITFADDFENNNSTRAMCTHADCSHMYTCARNTTRDGLRDEVRREGEELLSNLNVIQNMYCCRYYVEDAPIVDVQTNDDAQVAFTNEIIDEKFRERTFSLTDVICYDIARLLDDDDDGAGNVDEEVVTVSAINRADIAANASVLRSLTF